MVVGLVEGVGGSEVGFASDEDDGDVRAAYGSDFFDPLKRGKKDR